MKGPRPTLAVVEFDPLTGELRYQASTTGIAPAVSSPSGSAAGLAIGPGAV